METLMQKKLAIIATAMLLGMSVPANAAANMVTELGIAEQVEENAPTIKIQNKSVTVQEAQGMTLEIMSLTGKAIAAYKIEGPSQRIELNLAKGCYILKVGKTVRKVTLR